MSDKRFKKELLKDFVNKNTLDIKQTYILPINNNVYYIRYNRKWIIDTK